MKIRPVGPETWRR